MQLVHAGCMAIWAPSRVRCDHGGENNEICRIMEEIRRSGGSVLRGPSVHNQRVERSWVDVWSGISNVTDTTGIGSKLFGVEGKTRRL